MIRATILRNSSRDSPQGSGFQFGEAFGSDAPEAAGASEGVFVWLY